MTHRHSLPILLIYVFILESVPKLILHFLLDIHTDSKYTTSIH